MKPSLDHGSWKFAGEKQRQYIASRGEERHHGNSLWNKHEADMIHVFSIKYKIQVLHHI